MDGNCEDKLMANLDKDMKPWTWSKLLFKKDLTLETIQNDYEDNLIFQKQFNTFMILQYFSMSPHYNLIVNEINKNFLFNNKPEYLYKYLYYALPKENGFIKWIKGDKLNIKKLILNEEEWNRIFPDMPFSKIDRRIMESIQDNLKKELKEIKSQLKNI